MASRICTRIKRDLDEVSFVAYIKEEPKLRQWKACQSFPVLERKGEPPAFGWWGKVDCCMLSIGKHVAVIYTLFYRNFSHS